MIRCSLLAVAIGLGSATVAAAGELSLGAPELSAQADRCGARERVACGATGEHALETDLSCDACRAPPMPAELTSPSELARPSRRRTTSPECLPRASGAVPPECLEAPRLDTIPRP